MIALMCPAPYDFAMALYFILFALGLFLWTFLEYVIHGFLSHVFTTFATPFHAEHHRNPRAVFTAGVWMPTAIVSALIFAIFGLTPATTLWLGIVAGFIGYEMIHYRYHFA